MKSFWKGNIKKFGIAATEKDNQSPNIGKIVDCAHKLVSDPKVKVGDVLDGNGHLAIDPETNSIFDDLPSYWATTLKTAGKSRRAGWGIVLQRDVQLLRPENIHLFGTHTDLTDTSNLFPGPTQTSTLRCPVSARPPIRTIWSISFMDTTAYDRNGNGITN